MGHDSLSLCTETSMVLDWPDAAFDFRFDDAMQDPELADIVGCERPTSHIDLISRGAVYLTTWTASGHPDAGTDRLGTAMES